MPAVKGSNTFKVYKCNGRPALVLRVSLPRIEEESDGGKRFNELYSRLESECIDSAEVLAERLANEAQGNAYLSLSVSFTSEKVGEILKITRIYELKRGAKIISSKSVTDFFSQDLFLLKKSKNVIKQRFVPSRNAKNITKSRLKQ